MDFSVFVLAELFPMSRGRIEDEVVAREVVEEINKRKQTAKARWLSPRDLKNEIA